VRSNHYFVEYVKGLLDGGPVLRVRARGDGHGLYREGLMVAVVTDDLLYFCAHGKRGESLRMRGATQLQSGSRKRAVPFFRAPDAALDDPDYAQTLAEEAFRDAVTADLQLPPNKRKHRPE